MTLSDFAGDDPDQPALVFAPTDTALSYRDLDARSLRLAAFLTRAGLRPRGHVAILMGNEPGYYDVAWAAQRSGLYYTPVNWHLTVDEAAYIVDDCDATALVASVALGELAAEVARRCPKLRVHLVAGGELPGFAAIDAIVEGGEPVGPAPSLEGLPMYYSSGTTGRPKGVLRPWSGEEFGAGMPLDIIQRDHFGFVPDTVYLSPAPLYHAAPLGWSMGAQRQGGSVILMPRFDAADLLTNVERYRVTHLQLVPTMFVRLLRLPESVRRNFDPSSLRYVIHAAAPCPPDVKDAMLEWWGPRIYEYYSGTEANGFLKIGPDEARQRRGSVGKPVRGTTHIIDDDGNEVATGEVGTVFFEGTARFDYHKDPVATASAYNDQGWSTLGDMGYVDDDGYLYLTDRRSHMIISGGVNIYPQEIENVMALHPKVADVAVIGVPNAEMGEEVKAVVQPFDEADAGPDLAVELIAYCREHLAHFKCPRTVDFDMALPRTPTGKLAKRPLRDRYASSGTS